jgi:hypothetical protein
MSTTIDLRIYSKQLLQVAQSLDTLLDQVTAAKAADELTEVSNQSKAILAALTETQSGLLSASSGGLEAKLDPAEVRRGIALTAAELPLEPALMALREVAPLIEKARAQQASHAVVLVPLSLAYRHCIEALRPLAAAVDPRDLIKDR